MPLNSAGVPSMAAIQAAIDEAVAAGRPASGGGTINMAGTAQATTAVVFPAGKFDVPPRISVDGTGGTGAYNQLYLRAADVTASGMTVAANHRDGSSSTATITFDWIATP